MGSSAAGSVNAVIRGGSRRTCLCVCVCGVYSVCMFCGSDNRAKRRGSSTAAGEFFRFSGGDGCDAEVGGRTHDDRSVATAAARHAERHRNVELHVRDSLHHRVRRDRHDVRTTDVSDDVRCDVIADVGQSPVSRDRHVVVDGCRHSLRRAPGIQAAVTSGAQSRDDRSTAGRDCDDERRHQRPQ